MHDALAHGQSKPSFYHLTDEEVASVANVLLITYHRYRSLGRVPKGEKFSHIMFTYSGKRQRVQKTFTHADVVRAWLIADERPEALPRLDALLTAKQAEADKAALPGIGE